MKHTLSSGFLPIVALTILLFSVTFWLTGCFYETNDDIILTVLLNGFTGWGPISDLSLYLHGISILISKLYRILPGWPWYGLILYSLLLVISILAFRFIYQVLRPVVASRILYGIIILFYLTNWYEHVFWFNYSRLAILLAGVVGLNAWLNLRQDYSAFKKRTFGYGFLFLLALCIRPSFALFGISLLLPIFLFSAKLSRLNIKRTATLLFPFLLAGILFSAWFLVKSTPTQQEYRRLDVLKSQVLDYNWCCEPPVHPADKLLYTGLNHWFLADQNIQYYLQQQQPDWRYFRENFLYLKLYPFLRELILSHLMALILMAVHFIWLIKCKARDKIFYLLGYHFYFWAVIFSIGIFLKIPPRVLTPAISLLLLIHLTLPQPNFRSRKWPLYFKIFGLFLILIQLYKINHRVNWQQQRQKQSEEILNQITNNHPDYLIIAAGLENELRALSPFKNYFPGKQRFLFLTGWQTLDPHFPGYLQSLSGKSNLGDALETLSGREKVVWVSSPQVASFLADYFNYFYQKNFKFTLIKPVKSSSLPDNLNFYRVEKVE